MDQLPQSNPVMFAMQEAKYEPIQERTVVHQPIVPHPRDYIIWSICSLVYCNPFCFGLVAVYHSIKSRDMKLVRDLEAARTYGKSARTYNIVALTLIIISLIILVIIYGMFYIYIQKLAQQRFYQG